MEDQLKQLLEVGYKTKEVVDRLETNWEFDRKDFSEFQNRLGHLEIEIKQLREAILVMPKRTADKVSDAVEGIQQETQDLKDVMINKKVVALDKAKTQEQVKKHWWQKKGGK